MKIITIIGPTAVGKTKLSIELAKKYNAEIINGDSMQVYKQLDIATAKPTKDEMNGIVHHLFDFVDVNTNYTVFDYQKDCRRVIEEIKSRNKNVIIVGGTGLYIKAALFDYKFKEGTKYNQYENLSNLELYNKIKEHCDLDIHINNRKRLVRILNKIENNEEISSGKNILLYDTMFIGLTTDRKVLYNRIEERVDEMFEMGLLGEVLTQRKNFNTSKALNSGIGYKEFLPYFSGTMELENVKSNIKRNSKRYAKRQYTFFNNQFNVKWFDVNFDCFSETVNEIINYIGD